MKHFAVHVPATSANLGPGYDVIGMALEIYNRFEVTIGGPDRVSIEVEGEGAGELPADENNLIYEAFIAGCEMAGIKPPNIHIRQFNSIPLNRGMGSSATAVLGGLMIAGEIAGDRLDNETMLQKAIEMEGHPDNLMAAYMGGIVIIYKEGPTYRGAKFMPSNPLVAVLVIPDIQVSTKRARELLPDSYPIEDVVTNLRNISLLTLAFQSGNYGLLREAMKDRIHQPYRAELIPGFFDVVKAAEEKGAFGCAISGSGSTVIALCNENADEIADAMMSVFESRSIKCRSIQTQISGRGSYISKSEK